MTQAEAATGTERVPMQTEAVSTEKRSCQHVQSSASSSGSCACSPKQPQHLLGQEPVVEAVVAQEAVESRQGRAELDISQARELPGDGETRSLRGLTQCGD